MGTRVHPDASGEPYFVTFATYRRRQLFRDGVAAQLFLDTLFALRIELRFLLLAHAVMPDHVHLVIVPHQDVGLGKRMQHIKGRFARMHNAKMGSSGHLWQSRYYETAVRDEAALTRRVKYVEDNPVEAGLVATPEAYAYSSAAVDTGDLQTYLTDGAPG